MIEIFTALAVVVAWFVFRFDRHRRQSDAIEAAYGVLSAVHYGMVQGLTAGQAVGWGQIYFCTDYTREVAEERAGETAAAVMNRALDQVWVVPTEPLAKLATSTPHAGLLGRRTVAVANFALWRVRVFNQLVQQLTDFNTKHAVEILSDKTERERRVELAEAAASLSRLVHRDGVGVAWSEQPGGGRGWYGALVEALRSNMRDLEVERDAHRWRWLRDRSYVLIDVLVAAGLIAVFVAVLR